MYGSVFFFLLSLWKRRKFVRSHEYQESWKIYDEIDFDAQEIEFFFLKFVEGFFFFFVVTLQGWCQNRNKSIREKAPEENCLKKIIMYVYMKETTLSRDHIISNYCLKKHFHCNIYFIPHTYINIWKRLSYTEECLAERNRNGMIWELNKLL